MDISPLERRLPRSEAARYLTQLGYKTAPATLAKLACVGGGPVFESFGRQPLYTERNLLDWVASRSTGPRRSTSDKSVQRIDTTAESNASQKAGCVGPSREANRADRGAGL